MKVEQGLEKDKSPSISASNLPSPKPGLMNSKKIWQQPGYEQMVSVELSNEKVIVEFANQDRVEVEVKDLVGPDKSQVINCRLSADNHFLMLIHHSDDRWKSMLNFTDSINFISWDQVRELADPEFAVYYEELRVKENKRWGKAVEILRDQSGLDLQQTVELCKQSDETLKDLTVDELEKIEAGEEIRRGSSRVHNYRAIGISLALDEEKSIEDILEIGDANL